MVMEPRVIARFFSELFSSPYVAPSIRIVWHSGEPLTQPVAYYEEAIQIILSLRDRFAAGRVAVRFGLQTNGVLIDEEWCRFFVRHQEHFDLGVSCDGPPEFHDLYRVNWLTRPTHRAVELSMQMLKQFGVRYKIIAVVTDKALGEPERFYNYFYEQRKHLAGFHFNILAQSTSTDAALAYTEENRAVYYNFYRRMLELNRETLRRGEVFEIQNLSQIVARVLEPKDTTKSTAFNETSAPLKSMNVDARGHVTTFYAGLSADVLPNEYCDGNGLSLGNILEMPLEEMVQSRKLRRMCEDFLVSEHACRRSCEYFAVCPGGFDLLKRERFGSFDATETAECLIHIKTFTDALLDDVSEQVYANSSSSDATEVVKI